MPLAFHVIVQKKKIVLVEEKKIPKLNSRQSPSLNFPSDGPDPRLLPLPTIQWQRCAVIFSANKPKGFCFGLGRRTAQFVVRTTSFVTEPVSSSSRPFVGKFTITPPPFSVAPLSYLAREKNPTFFSHGAMERVRASVRSPGSSRCCWSWNANPRLPRQLLRNPNPSSRTIEFVTISDSCRLTLLPAPDRSVDLRPCATQVPDSPSLGFICADSSWFCRLSTAILLACPQFGLGRIR